MRLALPLVAALIVVSPLSGQGNQYEPTLSFLQKPQQVSDALQSYREPEFRPIRSGETRAGGFLTEGDDVAFGRALGPTTPTHLRGPGSYAVAMLGSSFAVVPPAGATYQVGDSLMAAIVRPGPKFWGDVVTPTAILVVTGHAGDQTITSVAAVMGQLRDGQAVMPLEPLVSNSVAKQVATGGPAGEFIASRETRELLQAGSYVFTDLGRDDGMQIGDLIEVRRRAENRPNAAATIVEPMATGQVVHVNGRSSTVRLVNIYSPDIAAGSLVVRTAMMPN